MVFRTATKDENVRQLTGGDEAAQDRRRPAAAIAAKECPVAAAQGAEKRDVLRMVVRQGLKMALVGVAIGLAGALALTRFLSSLVDGVKPTDPLTFVAVLLTFFGVATLACYIPARRATKVDPVVALRCE